MKKKINKTKQEWAWHFIYQYLLFLDNFAVSHTDEGYKKRLHDLRQYVDEKIGVEGEIIDFYITVLYKPED